MTKHKTEDHHYGNPDRTDHDPGTVTETAADRLERALETDAIAHQYDGLSKEEKDAAIQEILDSNKK